MSKINIVLVCNAGMSTSLLVKKLESAAKAKGIEGTISAYPVEDVKNHINDTDIVLLGPQVRFKRREVEEAVQKKIPVELIDMTAYGTMNGERILEQVLNVLTKTNNE